MTDAPDWAEQARRLVAGLGQTLGQTLREGARGAGDDGHPADCRWCPVCQVAAVVRGERPEVTAALADVLGAAAAALRSFSEAGPAAEQTPPTGAEAEPTGAEAEPTDVAVEPAPPAGAAPAVQRVEIA
ncbi:hypothetical protein ACI79C_23505 [Geodermatophilus sp. SYSU D00697]